MPRGEEAAADVGDSPYVSHSDDEVLINSGPFTGLSSPEAKAAIVAWLGESGRGAPSVNYRLRDWGFSRQRYWGCPIPIIHCPAHGAVPVPDEDLPVLLPELDDYRPKGEAPLASNEEWMAVTCPICGGPARREPDTMDTFVDSSWYFLRYCDPHNGEAPFDREIVDYWGPVDFYQGGVDHATMHMIYARFFQKALADLGLVGFREPFARFHGNGWVQLGGTKMSKSKGNVIGPDAVRGRVRRRPGPALHPVHRPRRAGHGVHRLRARGHAALRPPPVADRERGRRDGARGRRRDEPARPQGPRDDRARHRRHRPAGVVQHARSRP